jgi:hypothetical protein
MILLAAFALARTAPPEMLADPAYQLAHTMVGGVWDGLVAKKLKVEFRFHVDGQTGIIVGDGALNAGSPNPMPIRCSLGWDPAAKQIYYLDQHGAGTVYFGHVTRDGNALVFDFRGLVGDDGHYRSRQELSANDYTSDMSEEDKGTWTQAGLHIRMHRKT